MNLLDVLILSLVEGVTEFIPVSSTAHLMITAKFLEIEPSQFLSSFEIFIQLGAILAVVALFFDKVLTSKELMLKILIAFLPTALIGFLLYPFIKSYLLMSLEIAAISLLIGGIIIILFEYWYQKKERHHILSLNEITYKKALAIGLFQSIAFIPGTSRAGATILGGLALGLSRTVIVEFSFLLAIPTMVAATGYDLLQSSKMFSADQFIYLAFGFVFSFIFSLVAIKWFIFFVRQNDFTWFGYYRILAGVLILIFLL